MILYIRYSRQTITQRLESVCGLNQASIDKLFEDTESRAFLEGLFFNWNPVGELRTATGPDYTIEYTGFAPNTISTVRYIFRNIQSGTKVTIMNNKAFVVCGRRTFVLDEDHVSAEEGKYAVEVPLMSRQCGVHSLPVPVLEDAILPRREFLCTCAADGPFLASLVPSDE